MNPLEMLRALSEGYLESKRIKRFGAGYRADRQKAEIDNAVAQSKMREIGRTEDSLVETARRAYPGLDADAAIARLQADQSEEGRGRAKETHGLAMRRGESEIEENEAQAEYHRARPGIAQDRLEGTLAGLDKRISANEDLARLKASLRPPPTPSFTFVTSAEGIRPGNRRTGTLGDPIAQPRPPAAILAQRVAFQKATAALDSIKGLSDKIRIGEGVGAKVTGAYRSAKSGLNLDNDVALYKSRVRGYASLLARAVGHVGVLTEQDVQRTEALLGGVTESDSLRDAKLADFIQVMKAMQGLDPNEGLDPETSPQAFDKKAGLFDSGRMGMIEAELGGAEAEPGANLDSTLDKLFGQRQR